MEVSKQRTPLTVPFAHPVEFRVELIGQLARTAGRIEGIGRAVERGTILPDDVFPGVVSSSCAPTRQRQVGEVEALDEAFQLI